MHLASHHIHLYKDAGGRLARCRVRIYLPEGECDALVVICSEFSHNPGGSVTNSAETIAAGVILASELITPLYGSSTGPRRVHKDRRPASCSSSPAMRLRRECPTWGGEGMDRGRHMEAPRPYSSGGVGRWEGVGV